MSNLKKQVLESFKWKKNSEYSANRIGIPVSKYEKLKKEVLNDNRKTKKVNKFFAKASKNSELVQTVDLEKGEAKISGSFSYEPKSAEEIIKLLKIDTTKWKLSQYWNKQMSDCWRVSALVTLVKKDTESHLEELLANWKPKTYKIPKVNLSKINKGERVCGVMSIQDIHFGKEGNETVDKDFEDSIKYLLNKATNMHYIEKLYFVVGGDLINMDTFSGTTTGGTPVDNCMTATAAYEQGFDAMHWAINYIKAFCKELVIVYIPGNHDRLSSFHLAHALSKSITGEDITWDVKYEERKAYVWENNFNAFEHGDKVSKNTPLIYATEYPELWGKTVNRTLFKGHLHTDKKVDYLMANETAGFKEKTLPSLGKADYYHYSNKYTGNSRAAKLELQHPSMGNVCELRYHAL